MSRHFKTSCLFFIHSTKNIVGCLFGLVGLILFFLEIIDNNRLIIIMGLYLVGYRLTPSPPQIGRDYQELSSVTDLLISLDRMTRKVEKRLPPEMFDVFKKIRSELTSILQRFDDLKDDIHNTHVIHQIIVDYLPTILDAYMKVPPMYEKMCKSRDGQSAKDIALKQLYLLLEKIQETSKIISRKNISALRIHHEFLKSKFSKIS